MIQSTKDLSHKKEDIVMYTRDLKDKLMSKISLQKLQQLKKEYHKKKDNDLINTNSRSD